MRKWGHMFKSVLLVFVSLVIVISLFQDLSAQHYARIDDRFGIELSLDIIRKGVQEQDTAKVLMLFAPSLSQKGNQQVTRTELASRLQITFANSQKRRMILERPFYRTNYGKLLSSNFWDFDILEPQITIKGDSAFVDCELVLWGATPLPNSNNHGRRASERFVFYSPPKVALTNLPEDTGPFPEQSGRKIGSQRAWQLVGSEQFIEFLENQVNTNSKTSDIPQGEGKRK